MILALVEGTIVAYDSHYYQMMTSIQDSSVKGCCTLFTVHESSGSVIVSTQKKKIYLFHYQSGGNGNSPVFTMLRDWTLVDVPRSLFCIPSHPNVVAIIGYKKFYESISLDLSVQESIPNRILDVEKEHKMVTLEVVH